MKHAHITEARSHSVCQAQMDQYNNRNQLRPFTVLHTGVYFVIILNEVSETSHISMHQHRHCNIFCSQNAPKSIQRDANIQTPQILTTLSIFSAPLYETSSYATATKHRHSLVPRPSLVNQTAPFPSAGCISSPALGREGLATLAGFSRHRTECGYDQ